METKGFDPNEVIDLEASSDAGHSPTKKRPLEEAEEESGKLAAGEALLHDSKRLKREPSAEAKPKPDMEVLSVSSSEEGEIAEDPPHLLPNGEEARRTISEVDTGSIPINAPKGPAGWNPATGAPIARTSLSESVPSLGASVSPDHPLYHQGSLSFRLPSLSEKRENSWLARFKDWVHVFRNHNSEHAHAITPTLTHAAYAYYVDQYSGLKGKKRRSAKQAAQEFEDTGELQVFLRSIQPEGTQQSEKALQEVKGQSKNSYASGVRVNKDRGVDGDEASDSEVEYQPALGKSEQSTEAAPVPSAKEWASLLDAPAGANGRANAAWNGATMNLKGVPTGNEALEQQRRYFPSASDPAEMCLLCGCKGHPATSCPTLTCNMCGSNAHSDVSCPTLVRCDKCRQLGHRKAQCIEKLALTRDEGLACGICKSPSHLEEECTELWRSFHPNADTIHRVVSIPASCAMCGSNKHFSADCGGARKENYHNPTWTLKNRDQYVDPSCGSTAIEAATGGRENAPPMRGPDLKIRGHAARTTNVHYSESEDSDVEFLGMKKVTSRAPLGQIRMASNIQMPRQGASASRGDRNNRTYNTRSRSQTPVQPPLPPGPPPGLPSRQASISYPPPPGVSSYGTQQPIPPPSLPAKPPAPNRDYRNLPPPPHLQDSRGQSQRQNELGNASQGKGRGGQNRQQVYRGGRGGRGGGRGRGRGRGK